MVNNVQLFMIADARIEILYSLASGPKALAPVAAAYDAKDYPRAISLLLNATVSVNPNRVDELKLYRACYAVDKNKLFKLVKDRLK